MAEFASGLDCFSSASDGSRAVKLHAANSVRVSLIRATPC